MAEQEVKLQIPPASLAAVQTAMRRGRCATTRLHAIYYDTPQASLARAGWALRLRREGGRWVQAVKGPAEGVMSRFEHEVVLGRDAPMLDVTRHTSAPGAEALLEALGDFAGSLAPVFETDVRRLHRVMRMRGATIEIALDAGEIRCGDRRAAVSEMEFELVAGDIRGLLRIASIWAERHGLWLDVRSKAERGFLLARAEAASPPALACVPQLHRHDLPAAAWRAGLRAALAQLLPNAAALAAGAGGVEHVHQARVALRRLFALQRDFGAWAGAPIVTDALTTLRECFRALGGARDIDALAASLLPQLQAAGAPALSLRDKGGTADAEDPGTVFRTPATTCALLAVLGTAHADHAVTPAAPAGPPVHSLAAHGAPILARLHRRLRKAGKQFDSLDDAARHRARKQLKRLRYGAEFLSSLWPDKAWRNYLERLKAAQDALGAFQDLCVAHALFERRLAADPRVWFALGWIAARRPSTIDEAGAALRALGRLPVFLEP